jgi:hypothetical protein
MGDTLFRFTAGDDAGQGEYVLSYREKHRVPDNRQLPDQPTGATRSNVGRWVAWDTRMVPEQRAKERKYLLGRALMD